MTLMAACITAAGAARAQDAYPSQLVKIIVPATSGSTTDILARIVADELTQKWSKPVVVENVPGGAMNVAAERVARASGDGYTLFVAPPSPLTINRLLYHDLAYDPDKFVPITLLAKVPNALVARRDLAAKSVPELIGYAKGNPGKLTYASQGVGSTAHLSASQLEVETGIRMVHVPYRGAMPALNDIIAGHVDLFFDTATTSVPLFQSGQIKILAVAGPQRAHALPDVPTMQEAGLLGFRSITWFGLVAPPGVPPPLVARINHDVVEILTRRGVSDKLRALRLEPAATTPEETASFFAGETTLWGKVIKDANIRGQ
jgi:tripartite-type tricarboxylate transporter receptor subunit TctC